MMSMAIGNVSCYQLYYIVCHDYLQPVVLTDEGCREDDDVEGNTEGVKYRESEDELEKRLLEIQG